MTLTKQCGALILLGAMLVSPATLAQLTFFQNGQPADASAVNANFQHVMEAIPLPANVITVSSEGAAHTSLASAVASIANSDQGNPYLIDIGPGIYDECGDGNSLSIPAFVTVRGSGVRATEIRCPGGLRLASGAGLYDISLTVNAFTNSVEALYLVGNNRVSNLIIEATQNSAVGLQGILADRDATDIYLTHAAISVSGAVPLKGINTHNCTGCVFEDVVITVTSGGVSDGASGISRTGYGDTSRPLRYDRLQISVTGGDRSTGVSVVDNNFILSNAIIDVTGRSAEARGISAWDGEIVLNETSINVLSSETAGSTAHGIYASESTIIGDAVTVSVSGSGDADGLFVGFQSEVTLSGAHIHAESSANEARGLVNTGGDALIFGDLISAKENGIDAAAVSHSGSSTKLSSVMISGSITSDPNVKCQGTFTTAFVALDTACQ